MRLATRLRPTSIRPTRIRPARARGGIAPGSVTFPATRLSFRVQIALGADLTASWLTWSWVDITAFVRYADGISTRTGRPDESSVVTPGRTTLTLDNRDGRFSRRNPTGPYYGLLSKNTPIWVQVDAGSGFRTRVQHYVNEWPTRWDKSGNDSTVTITASGILRRLAQGQVLSSALRQAILGGPAPMAYWPLEEGSDAAAGASGIIGGSPMRPLGPVNFGAEGFGGSTASVDLGGAASLGTTQGTLGTLTGAIDGNDTNEFRFEYSCNFGTDPFDTLSEVDIFSGPPGFTSTTVGWSTGHNLSGRPTLLVQTFPGGVPTLIASASISSVNVFDGLDHHIALDVRANGTSADYVLTADGVYTTSGTAAVALADPVPALTAVQVNGFGSGFSTPPTAQAIYRVGHLVFYDAAGDPGGDHAGATLAYAGEMAHERIERVCGEAGIAYASTGATARSQRLGPQPIGTPLQIIRDAEAVDRGVLFEAEFGLGYQGKQQRYNAPVLLALDFGSSHIAEPPQPADDDQRTRNRFTASRPDGAEATVEDAASIAAEGLYDDSATVNVYSDEQLPNIAGWRVHGG